MIFCGDLVFPGKFSLAYLRETDSVFLQTPKLVNLESAIHIFNAQKKTKGVALASDPDIINFFKHANIIAVSLANNHIFDYPLDIDQQIDYLNKANISTLGAGKNLQQAAIPYVNTEKNLVTLAFGWHVIGCRGATQTSAGINPYNYPWVAKKVSEVRKAHPGKKLVTSFHWNYEFEGYPQPADREFAHHLIDLGVDAIVGHHAHIIQGFEYYRRKPIFYGLGNCYFPNGHYDGFDILYPKESNIGLSVDLSQDQAKAYLTELRDNQKLWIMETGRPEEIDTLMAISQFQGMDTKAYQVFFAKHRKKRKLLPIYYSYQNKRANAFNDLFVKGRQVPVDIIARLRGGSK